MTSTRRPPDSESPAAGRALLAWYDRHRRDLPWRARAGERPDPYRVWLSEVMLQQTTVATVGPYYARFLARWPTVDALAAASRADVLAAWAGLGYYARARNLHACAQSVARDHGGVFPDTEAGLRALPGIGVYTAGAIVAIAFDRPALAIDGNVERVITRLRTIETPLPAAKAEIRTVLAGMLPADRPGDFAQALMDLGATVCTPRAPRCAGCPWRRRCRALAADAVARFPIKPPRRARPLRHGVAFVLHRDAREVWLTERAEAGLLGGMRAVPTTAWSEAQPDDAAMAAARPGGAGWRLIAPIVRHGFTHFDLQLRVAIGRGRPRRGVAGEWWPLDRLSSAGLPTLFRKVVEAALSPPRDAATSRPSHR